MATKKSTPRKRPAKRTAAAVSARSKKPAQPPVDPITAAARFSLRGLDARPDRIDFRDLPYRPPLKSLEPAWPSDPVIAHYLGSYVKAGLVRDQGFEGACTGFGLASVANYLLFTRALEARRTRGFMPVSPRMLYELARRYDEWPGVDYEWSSCRGALKGWNKHGVCAEALWPFVLRQDGTAKYMPPRAEWASDATLRPLGVYYRVDARSIVDLQAALNDIGAVYVSSDVHDGWDRLLGARKGPLPTSHASLPTIPPPHKPRALSGHAFVFVGYNRRGFVVQNSWGETWGARGFAVLRYEDWVEHGTDAWVCALGVPIDVSQERIDLTRVRVPAGTSLGRQAGTPRNPANPPDDPWPIDHVFDHDAYQPWSTAAAYDHTLVSGNEGALIASDVTFQVGRSPEPYAKRIVQELPSAFFGTLPAKAPAKLLIYAHGGLNSEDESIRRIRVLGPYAKANGIYPLFLTWKSGPVETLVDMFEDQFSRRPEIQEARVGGVRDALREGADRFVEATSHLVLRGIWSEMRENAEASIGSGRAIDLLAQNLIGLRDALGAGHPLEVHLVGHSAGSIVLGTLLRRLLDPKLIDRAPSISTCTLFAAACSVQFALLSYGAAAQSRLLDLGNLRMHYLSDENEQDDGLPEPASPLYGKSLLYLVSRALDDFRKMPLLGMQKAITPSLFDPDDWEADQGANVLPKWWALWRPDGPDGAQRGFPVKERDVRVTKDRATIQSTHGSFDNNIDVLTATLERIRGTPLVAPIEWLDY